MSRNKGLSKEDEENVNDFFANRGAFTLDKMSINIKCKTPGQKELVNSVKGKEVTICSGPAGTGKTYLACAQALKLIKAYPNKYKHIVLVKSVTTLKDEEIGYLKGGLEDKMEPFMYSFMHNFQKILKSKKVVTELRALDIINVMPIAYMRGINLDNSIVIIDEAQNISIDNIRTILTRLGSNSKMVFLGDTLQVDKRNKKDSALEFIIDNFGGLDEMGLIRLTTDDVVRNPLIKKIEAKFDEVLNNK